MLVYLAVGVIGLAIQAREKLISLKPDHELAKKAIYLIGRNFQDIGVYESAAFLPYRLVVPLEYDFEW